jgi:hypothetical protein
MLSRQRFSIIFDTDGKLFFTFFAAMRFAEIKLIVAVVEYDKNGEWR